MIESVLPKMDPFANFRTGDFAYAVLTVVISVVVILAMRRFGNLPIALFGVDLNLLTYRYLWDTAAKALKGAEYWPRWNGALLELNKPTVLFLICLINVFLLAWNMKLLDKIERSINTNVLYTNLALKPFSIALGLTSLIAFLYFNSVWG